MPSELVWDAETGSQVKLGGKIKGTNISVYMKHPSTRVWCFAYSSLNGAEPEIWKPGDPVPEAFRSADRFVAHNVEFERALWRYKLIPEFGFPPLPPSEKWFCTMAAAQMTGLVGGLKTIRRIFATTTSENRQRRHAANDETPRRTARRGSAWGLLE